MILGGDTIIEQDSIVPDKSESARKKLVRLRVEADLTTYSDSFSRSSCSFLSQGASSSPSSPEYISSSRAMAESSLFFTSGDFCSSINEHRDGSVDYITS